LAFESTAAQDSIVYVSDQEIEKQFEEVLFDLKILGDWFEKI